MAADAVPSVSFATLPPDILTRIALESVLLSRDIPTIEDLTSMLALVFTCRAINDALSLSFNPSLYATVFRLMFDITAIQRRLGSAAVVSSALAREFTARIRVLLRIRAASEAGYWDSTQHRDDWSRHGNSYVRKMLLIMTENEEKNCYQLTSSGIMQVSDALVTQLLRFGLDSTPPSHQPSMASTFSLMWMLSSQDFLAHEDPDRRAAILDFLEPLMLRAYEPAKEFKNVLDKTYPRMPSRYFGYSLNVRTPSLMQLARLCSVDRYNAAKNNSWTGGGFKLRASSSSTRFDVDWLRMVSILGSPSSENILTGNAYTIGQFEGIFEGAFFITHFTPDSSKFFTSSRYMQCCLREYHSIFADESIQFVEENEHREGDALARAWFPEDIKLYEEATSLRIHDPSQSRSLHYRTYSWYSSALSGKEVPAVYDTILIGETHPSFAQFGVYGFHGRVRARDGTVVLVRTPIEPLLEDEGTLVFVGHLHAETDFVGDWRMSSIREDIPGGYGWFHVSKTKVIGSLEM